MRARWVKPEFFNDKKIGKLGPIPALVFQALWCMADDGGTAPCTPEIIKGQMFMYWTEVGLPEITEALRVLCEAKRLERYTVGDEDYAIIRNWDKHQAVHNPSKFRYPKPQQQVTGNTEAGLKQEGGSPHILDTQTPIHPDSQTPRLGEGNTPAPPLVVLPKEATAFLAMFYEPALTEQQRQRYKDIRSQLYDVLDPRHAGVKIRGGQRAKARSAAHLTDCINAVMKNPPPNRDLAIVWLLNKLMDPEKGPTVTEIAKREEQVTIRLEERYQREAKRAGGLWAKEHPDEFGKIVSAVDSTLSGASGEFAKVARESALTQRCAVACGFPPFEKWKAQIQSHQPETTAA